MLEVHALEFLKLGESSSTTRSDVFFGDGHGDLYDHQKEQVKEAIIALSDLSEKIGLTTSLTLLKARENNLPKTRREWELLVDAVRAELKTNLRWWPNRSRLPLPYRLGFGSTWVLRRTPFQPAKVFVLDGYAPGDRRTL